jgi:hypothetical protein
MLWDIAHNPMGTKHDADGRTIHVCDGCAPRFFEAKLMDGVLAMPEKDSP